MHNTKCFTNIKIVNHIIIVLSHDTRCYLLTFAQLTVIHQLLLITSKCLH